ncbi:hypothetical protein B0T17DRAFT_504200 [Bombardia bombarda]|uniref:Uncharacterized protein n=1 Tax=Bombardia bombarda TaxID=252184 RepID=A0AA40CFP5_9PEZI|nr:hypothetical protein B0T17DRAFT_504200 [Bombardia bombarda]
MDQNAPDHSEPIIAYPPPPPTFNHQDPKPTSTNPSPHHSFDGGVETRIVTHPGRAFAFEVTFNTANPILVKLAGQKPPLHFHPYQAEYMEVLAGRLMVEVDGHERVLRPEDGEMCVQPWAHHRLYPPALAPGDRDTRTVFLLSGDETPEVYKLDLVFFTNWYAYQDEVFLRGKRLDLVQVMSMFDAGASYLSLPWWVPFGRSISRALGIAVGRWIGGLLGYQPFHRKWTLDWETACQRMETTMFQRRFADRRAKED